MRVLVLSLVTAVIALVAWAGAVPGGLATSRVARITFVDVGQGDAVVMKIGGKVIVSDAGEFKLANINKALTALGATRIDLAILSHPHQDHVKNFAALFAQWEVRKAVLSRSDYWQGPPQGPTTNKAVIDAITAEGLQPTFVHAGQTFTWGGARWKMLNPPTGQFTGGKDDAPNASIAYLLTVNGVRALFTGDVEAPVEDKIAQRLDPLIAEGVDIFLATHHGSKEGSNEELLDVAHPRWAVLSTGRNTFGHPAPRAIDRLKAIGASIWCTDTNGSITARISTTGKLTWTATRQTRPWWTATTMTHHGKCVERR